MNIFFTSDCPEKCAEYLDDKRVVKMCLETVQMLSTAINEHGGQGVYKSTHANHPSNVWARETLTNYYWLTTHAIALGIEYKKRYNRNHKSIEALINSDMLEQAARLLPDRPLTDKPNCAANSELGLCFKHIPNIYDAYRQYLDARFASDKRTPTWYGSTDRSRHYVQ